MNLIPYAVPFFLVLIVVEIVWGTWHSNNTYRVNDALNSVSLGMLSTATKLVSLNVGGLVFSNIEQNWAVWRLDSGSAWAWVFGLLLYDFLYYWFHRISHERQIFWASHVVHHQSEDYNLSTALRQTSTSFLLTWVFFVPCFILGMPVEMYVTIAGAHLIYQFWVHTRHIPKLGFAEWFMITPSNHRVHHAQNSRYIDKNYGGLLIIWDRLFGTFTEEDEAEEIVYGISTPLSSWNPLWANFHIFAQMAMDAWRTDHWREKFTIWASRTGWRPADVAQKFPQRKSDLQNFAKYDPPMAVGALAAVLVHFLLIAVVDVWFAWHAVAFPYVVQAGYVGLLLYTLILLGAVLNRSPRALAWELLRWLLVAAALTGAGMSGLLNLDQVLAGAAYLLLSAPLMLWAVKSVVADGRSGLLSTALL